MSKKCDNWVMAIEKATEQRIRCSLDVFAWRSKFEIYLEIYIVRINRKRRLVA